MVTSRTEQEEQEGRQTIRRYLLGFSGHILQSRVLFLSFFLSFHSELMQSVGEVIHKKQAGKKKKKKEK